MNPILIAIIVILAAVGAWFGLSQATYNTDGSVRIPFLSAVPKFPLPDFGNLPSFDWRKIFSIETVNGITRELEAAKNSLIGFLSGPLGIVIMFFIIMAVLYFLYHFLGKLVLVIAVVVIILIAAGVLFSFI